jgi:hypothetical protein
MSTPINGNTKYPTMVLQVVRTCNKGLSGSSRRRVGCLVTWKSRQCTCSPAGALLGVTRTCSTAMLRLICGAALRGGSCWLRPDRLLVNVVSVKCTPVALTAAGSHTRCKKQLLQVTRQATTYMHQGNNDNEKDCGVCLHST